MSQDTAEDFAKQTALLAKAEGVAPQAVMKDIAESSEAIAKFSDGSVEGLAKAAIMAKKLGTNLDTVANIAENILDFQNSLNKEVEASILLGRDLNYQKARELALNNDIEGAMAEIVGQLGGEEEFNKMNVIQRKALADSIGVSVDQLAKFVRNEEKARSLGDAISEQPGLESMVGEESMDNIAKIIADFKVMGAQLIEDIGPTLLSIAGTVGTMVSWLATLKPLLPILIGYFITMKSIALMTAVAKIWAGAMESTSKIPFVGVFIGIAAAVAATAAMIASANSAGDMLSDATKGKTMISPREGGLYEMSPNDDILAGPGMAKAMTNKIGENQNTLAGSKAATTQPVVQSPTVNVDTSGIERGNAAVQGEMTALRQDMADYFGVGGTAARSIGTKVGDRITNNKSFSGNRA
jgi:hypothetical protein